MADLGYPIIPSRLRSVPTASDMQIDFGNVGGPLPAQSIFDRIAAANLARAARTGVGTGLAQQRISPAMAQSMAAAPSGDGATQRLNAAMRQQRQQRQQQPGFFDSLPAFDSPAGRGLGAMGTTLLQMSGYSPTPITLGQALGAAGQAGMEAYTAAKAAEQKSLLDLAKAETEFAKAAGGNGGYFQSKSFTADKYNTLIGLSPKIKSGEATGPERQAYSLAYQSLSQPRTETRQTAEGVKTVNVPALDLSGFATPEGFQPTAEKVIGEKITQFSGEEANAGGFAIRMQESISIFDDLEGAGYDPTNFQDQYSPSTMFMSVQGQQYDAAKRNFINAQLRKESGAAIAESEFANADKQYFPQFGDSDEVLAQKRQARKSALEAMVGMSGGSYDVLFDEPEDEPEPTGLPQGSTLMKTIGDKKFFKAPDGSVYIVE